MKYTKQDIHNWVRVLVVEEELSAPEVIKYAKPMIRQFERDRDLKISADEMRRMYQDAVESRDARANRGTTFEIIGRFCQGPSPEERRRMEEAEEAAAVKAGIGTPLHPHTFSTASERNWYDEAPAKEKGRRRKRSNATA